LKILNDKHLPFICGLKFQIMRIGIPKEIKTEEYRVAITPSGVEELG
jgi:L-alanine dehydrogenase (EC 1.4.1.1)